jgi:hypothetical protein
MLAKSDFLMFVVGTDNFLIVFTMCKNYQRNRIRLTIELSTVMYKGAPVDQSMNENQTRSAKARTICGNSANYILP